MISHPLKLPRVPILRSIGVTFKIILSYIAAKIGVVLEELKNLATPTKLFGKNLSTLSRGTFSLIK